MSQNSQETVALTERPERTPGPNLTDTAEIREWIKQQDSEALARIVASTSPTGRFAEWLGFAKAELCRRAAPDLLAFAIYARNALSGKLSPDQHRDLLARAKAVLAKAGAA